MSGRWPPTILLRRSEMAWVAVALGIATPATAQSVVTSDGPKTVSVSIYRDPDRAADGAISRASPQGYALITETRTISLPAGRSTIRFEGVAGNIFPETAIVTGLPVAVREKNLDADLLSPRSLYDRALGRRVIVRRTDRATGRVREEQATIRSGANGAAVLQTGAGYEALRCSGLPETIVYDSVPAGLSAKPTLSIDVDNPAPVAATATVTLSYLAGGFDWQADYVIQMQPGGTSADITAWITLASSDVTSFVGTGAQVIAGKPNRESTPEFGNYTGAALNLQCWANPSALPPPPPPPPPPMFAPAPVMAMEARAMDSIVVTDTRMAQQEELGDLKLYRIADPVTVSSQAQKQVGLLSKTGVRVTVAYVSDVDRDYVSSPVRTIRARNRADAGLGLALPAGNAVIFEGEARPILVGEASTDDKAVGEDVEFKLGDTPGVDAAAALLPAKGRTQRYRLSVSNANPWPIAYEAKFAPDGGETRFAAKLGKRDGKALWTVMVPANGTATLDYSIRPSP